MACQKMMTKDGRKWEDLLWLLMKWKVSGAMSWLLTPFGPGASLGLGPLWAWGPFGSGDPLGLEALRVDQKVVSIFFSNCFIFLRMTLFFLKNHSGQTNFFNGKMCRKRQTTLSTNFRLGPIRPWNHHYFPHSYSSKKWKQFSSPNLSKNQYHYWFFSN